MLEYSYLLEEIKASPSINGCLNMIKTAIMEGMNPDEVINLIEITKEKLIETLRNNEEIK